MKKKYHFFIFSFFLIFFLVSCSPSEQPTTQEKIITASAQAKAGSDGTITFTEPSEDDIKSLEEFSKKVKKVDSEFPGPKIDFQKIKDFQIVQKILPNGTLVLKNGKIIGFAGCDCGNDFLKYLRNTFNDESYQVYYIPSGCAQNEITYAYIWEVNVTFGDDISTTDFPIGPSFSQLNEMAVLNKWCKPIKQPDHIYYKRYLALSRLN